jgi:transposase
MTDKQIKAEKARAKIYSGNKYSAELKVETIRAYNEARSEHPSKIGTARHVAELMNIGCPETVLMWVDQAQVDLGNTQGLTTAERREITKLRKENAELKRANSFLKKASTFFAKELDSQNRF